MVHQPAAKPPAVPEDDPRSPSEWEARLRELTNADLMATIEDDTCPEFVLDLAANELRIRAREVSKLEESLSYAILRKPDQHPVQPPEHGGEKG
jgi:hypothetical protein